MGPTVPKNAAIGTEIGLNPPNSFTENGIQTGTTK